MTYILLFAWLPFALSFAANGPVGDYVLCSLLLFGFFLDSCRELYVLGSVRSKVAITLQYQERFARLMAVNDFDNARECMRAEELFGKRGAA